MRTRDAFRRREYRRSTLAGLGGIVLIAVGLILTAAKIGGNVLPTVLAILGLGCIVAGIGTGALLVLNNFRYRRDQSFYDPDEEEDD